MTASQLRDALAAAGVSVAPRGTGVTLTGPVPPALWPPVNVLKTGLLALASGRHWWGCEDATGRWVRLDPRHPVPTSVALLACEGAVKWDRIQPDARLKLPHLFAVTSPPKRVKR